jgi:hypothetical protein
VRKGDARLSAAGSTAAAGKSGNVTGCPPAAPNTAAMSARSASVTVSFNDTWIASGEG